MAVLGTKEALSLRLENDIGGFPRDLPAGIIRKESNLVSVELQAAIELIHLEP